MGLKKIYNTFVTRNHCNVAYARSAIMFVTVCSTLQFALCLAGRDVPSSGDAMLHYAP
jgi:hypothetical protein